MTAQRISGVDLAARLERLPFVEHAVWSDDKGFEMFGDIGVLTLRAPNGQTVGRAFPPHLDMARMGLEERNARMLRGGRAAAIGLADGLIEQVLQDEGAD